MLQKLIKKHPLFYSFIAVGLLMFGLVYVPCNVNIVYQYTEGRIEQVPNVMTKPLTILGILLSTVYPYINKSLKVKSNHYILSILVLVSFPTYKFLLTLKDSFQPYPTIFNRLNELLMSIFGPIIIVFFDIPGFILNLLFKEFSILLPLFIIIPSLIGSWMMVNYISYIRSL